MNSVSVVIPCYNEAEGIKKVIEALPPSLLEILVVDNNSTDESALIALSSGARVVKEERKGYGYALRKGFEEAKGDIIITIDADGQYPAGEVEKCVNYFNEQNLDFLVCSRFPLIQKDSMNMIRRIGNLSFTCISKLLFGLPTSDSWSGMMCFKRSLVSKLSLESTDMQLSQEIKIRAFTTPGIRFGEIHVGYSPRVGDSKLAPFRHGLRMLKYYVHLKASISARSRIDPARSL